MLFKTFAAVLVAATSVSAHTIFNPALGVTGTPARSNVGRPTANNACAGQSAAAIDTTTPVVASADGTFTVTAQDFNAGADGARSVASAKVDVAGTGKNFAATATVVTNGDPAPKTVGTSQITLKMPAGTTCAGGKSKNLCLVSLTTPAKFGNCVVVQQGGAAASSNTNATTAATNAAATNAAAAATGGKQAKAAKQQKNGHGVGSAAAQAAAIAKAGRSIEDVAEPVRRAISRFFLKEMA